jgi:rare lipoprotein A
MSKILALIIVLATITYECGPSFNYEEIGLASYYNDALEGNLTASGEIFSQDSLTAAHKTLPLGSKVFVTNIINEKSIWVTINDRGPFVKNRILDLSKRAADSLDMIKPGIISVKVETYLAESEKD